ncbi:carboxypeptidase-like regulatory domain-containing protein [Aestuariibaculum sp. YM273]|uniref:carboxypeptidase-like regulatory domain-containing protein n=1 Tax=Aestuariibaculum sp. YM273 TaxID=3070659 RepID=UPI0027DE2FF3|nr:carboxypeptidase-like regulatory domain-containing protein [Aestuariibaculum sp. YM273]WMI66163.1 carboxypeptidase-like regulatory domain-containing protein [Aestuariibaculum sp. YM273]
MKLTYTFFFCIIWLHISVSAQETIKATILDSITQNPIPFATISTAKNFGVISNEYGEFQINLNTTEDIDLIIQCLGYESKNLPVKKFKDSIVLLRPKSIELDEVLVSNKHYTPEEIIDKVKDNLLQNYSTEFTKSTLFSRTSFNTKMQKQEIDIKKSSIPELNQTFIDSVIQSLPKNNDYHTELLGDLYTNNYSQSEKLNVIKASKLYNKDTEINLKGFQNKLKDIAQKHIKRDSYLKIKSGWFGTKESIDSSFFDTENNKQTKSLIDEQEADENSRKELFLMSNKQVISNLINESFVSEKSDLNFIHKSNKYEYQLLDYAFLNDDFVYKISFTPKRGADYQGVLYINTDDFAVVRVDYRNVKDLRNFSLLGFSFKEYKHEGTLIYGKNEDKSYSLRFAENTQGHNIGIERPLKIVEKNKNTRGRRKQNELVSDIHFILSSSSKQVLVVFENHTISENEYNSFKENPKVTPTYLPAYDPDFWAGYNIIEPNQAIKDFKIME